MISGCDKGYFLNFILEELTCSDGFVNLLL